MPSQSIGTNSVIQQFNTYMYTVPAEDLGVIGKRADDPVDEALEHGVQQALAEVEQEWTSVALAILEIDEIVPLAVGVPQLVGQPPSPYGAMAVPMTATAATTASTLFLRLAKPKSRK